MAMTQCGECRNEMSDRAKACPRCGAPSSASAKATKWWLWIPLGAVALFVLWALVREQSPQDRQRMLDRLAIEECWKDQQRKSHDPGTARFIAGACEKMEADFRAKHNATP